jgi:uncharacterized damage-inducible protein DinB
MKAVEEIVYLLDEAFRGGGIEETEEAQSLLANLRHVDDGAWRATPAGGMRTIESIALHVGGCKVMYDAYAFGSGALTWDDREVAPWREGRAPREATIGWLADAHGRLVEHVRSLDDEDLARPRPANWGEMRETRWLLSMLLQHDTYHAGEINHVRALLASDDTWKWA